MKYNLSEIMKNAWATFKKLKDFIPPISFSECLKRAWSAARKASIKVEEITMATIKSAARKLVESGEYESISYKEWSGYDKNRVYIKAIRHTLAGNVRIADCGYWDIDNDKYVSQAIDLLA